MGMGHLKNVNPKAKLVAVCDVDENHLKNAQKAGGKDVRAYKDFREVLRAKGRRCRSRQSQGQVRCVTTKTTSRTPKKRTRILAQKDAMSFMCRHRRTDALISIAAAKAGKDIWCEKPLSRTIYEGEKVVEAVNKYKRIFRLNTWFRFRSGFYGMGIEAKPIKKLVMSGILGGPLKVTVSGVTGFNWKHNWSGRTDLTKQPVPKNLDYDMWLGPAPYKPYHPHRVHGTFRGYWDYDGGGLGDMGQHYLDPVQYILGKDNESPVQIEADTQPQHHDAVLPWREIRMKYADGTQIILDGENRYKEAAFIEGPNGKLFKGFKSDIPDLEKRLAEFPEPEPQVTDFIEAVKERKKFALNEVNGHRSCTIVNLAKIALRTRRRLKFDSDKQRFINDDEANGYIKQPMRGPWKV